MKIKRLGTKRKKSAPPLPIPMAASEKKVKKAEKKCYFNPEKNDALCVSRSDVMSHIDRIRFQIT